MAEEKRDDGKVEEAVVSAYIEAELDGTVTHAERVQDHRARHQFIKEEYVSLKLRLEEAKAIKDEDLEARIAKLLRKNYLSRRYHVHALRAFGEAAEDGFVPA